MRWFLLIIPLILMAPVYSGAQISQGGVPLKVPVLKSRGIPEKTMPAVNNLKLRREALTRFQQAKGLKPFRFAHGFDVDISPGTDGIWTPDIGGYDVWQLRIRSAEAYSLNLIFENFHLPAGARLFLYNPDQSHILGAFTSLNNKASGKFAVLPVAGDELVVQYEVPAGAPSPNDFVIRRVNHDFTGILKNERRPLGETAGDCNIDIHCPEGARWQDIKDAVCRMIVDGREICSGTLVNNTEQDQTPYILSAAHCYDRPEYAETSVYTFNYESPYCAPLDGDPSHSVSGAVLKAQSDSLDFALTELSLIPPPGYRPYYAGWDRTGTIPDSTFSIHHPQGDIKKIAVDRNPPIVSDYDPDYTPDGFLYIRRWDAGVTEPGSSGGALFNPGQLLIGSLTGGEALCGNPVNDYFSRFSRAWVYKPDQSKQLKHWLDPFDTGMDRLEGKRFFEDENFCAAFTNLTLTDDHQNVALYNEDEFAGYWGGTNSLGIDEFAERFYVPGNETLSGISLGIGKIVLSGNSRPRDNEITLKVYNGDAQPRILIHSQPVAVNTLVPDAMNFIPFTVAIEPADTFFVGFELSNMTAGDTLVLFQSLRPAGKENFFFFKQDRYWFNFREANMNNYAMANVMELVACNVDFLVNDTSLVKNPMDALIYPNPTGTPFTFEAGQPFEPENIRVFNLLGQEAKAHLFNHRHKKIQVDLSGNLPGVYFVQLKTATGAISKKVSWAPGK